MRRWLDGSRIDGCKRHAPKPRHWQPLKATMHASRMLRGLAGGSSCEQQWMPAACAGTSPAAAPASHDGCRQRALMLSRRPHLPAAPQCMQAACTVPSPAASPAINNGCMRLALRSRLENGRDCPKQRMQAACAGGSTAAASMDASGMRRSRATGSPRKPQCMPAACFVACAGTSPAAVSCHQ